MTLTIAIFGAILIAAIFEISTRFAHEERFFVNTYSDQVLAGNYIERAKGMISSRIAETGVALHPRLYDTPWAERPTIESLEDLRVYIDPSQPETDPLNVDEQAAGNRRVEMRVYDLTYSVDLLHAEMTEEEMLRLPPPLSIASLVGGRGDSFANAGWVTGEGDIRYADSADGSGDIDLNDIGAYLIRVRIFDGASGRLERTAEEAFFILARELS